MWRWVLATLATVQALRSKDIDQLINGGRGTHHGGFPSYMESLSVLNALTAHNPLLVKSFVAGISVECRPIHLFLLSGMGFRKSAASFNAHIANVQQNLATKMLGEEALLLESCSNATVSTSAANAAFWSRLIAKRADYPPPSPDDVGGGAGVLMTALHHAREPSSLTVPLNVFNFLTQQVGSWVRGVAENRTAIPRIATLSTALIAERDIYFVPFVNPDGYVAIDHGGDIHIRKNRRRTCTARPHKFPLTLQESLRDRLHPLTDPTKKPLASEGVDLNRNYDNNFKSIHDGCDVEEYEGPSAFSEPETRAVRRIASTIRPKIALNFHAYGNLWTHPYNCCPEKAFKDGDEQVFEEIRESLNITQFGSAPNLQVLGYTTSGEADDYLYDEFGVFSMSPEVGPEHGGFYPDKALIRSINTENLEVVLKVIVKAGPQLRGGIIECEAEGSEKMGLKLSNAGLSALPSGKIFLRTLENLTSPPPNNSAGDHLRLSLDQDWLSQAASTVPRDGAAAEEAWIWKNLPSGLKSRDSIYLTFEDGELKQGSTYEVCLRPDPDTAQTKFLSNLNRDPLSLPPVCNCAWLSNLRCDEDEVAFVLAPPVPTYHPCASWSLGADE